MIVRDPPCRVAQTGKVHPIGDEPSPARCLAARALPPLFLLHYHTMLSYQSLFAVRSARDPL